MESRNLYAKVRSFTDLVVWQKAHRLMIDVYDLVKKLPSEEKYNRRDQLIRCASSVPANIAEGYGRYHFQENLQFCRQARGSLTEVQNHIIAARDLQQIPAEISVALLDNCEEVLKLLNAYISSTKSWQKKFR